MKNILDRYRQDILILLLWMNVTEEAQKKIAIGEKCLNIFHQQLKLV